MKRLLYKVVDPHYLSMDELFTLLVEIESVLNSRPLLPLDSGPEDGTEVLTPGHFLVGKALKSIPTTVPIHRNINVLRRWNLCQRLAADYWEQWVREYVLYLQRFNKWSRPQRQVQVCDIVLLKDTDLFVRSQGSWKSIPVMTVTYVLLPSSQDKSSTVGPYASLSHCWRSQASLPPRRMFRLEHLHQQEADPSPNIELSMF